MTTWQAELVRDLRARLGDDAVRPYGSFAAGTTDRWSDLDVTLRLDGAVPFADLVPGAAPWAWQVHDGHGEQTARIVLRDGRWVDVRSAGGRIVLPEPADDVDVRFDAALALVRIGRGAHLIGLHLLLGVLRETLVLGMRLADRDTGTAHHRSGTGHDALARDVADVLARPIDTELPTAVCALYGRTRAELEPAYRADWSALGRIARVRPDAAAGYWHITGQT